MEMVEKQKVEQYLREFKSIADSWFKDIPWLIEFYEFYRDFYNEEQIQHADWAYFQQLQTKIHAFNSLPLARARALNRPNMPIEDYRRIFGYIMTNNDSIDIVVDNLLNSKSEYKIKNFGTSSISELIANAYPDKFVYYNSRDIDALKILGIELKKERKESLGSFYKRYNEVVLPIIELYAKIVGKKTNTTLQIEIDQFFSWLYETKRTKHEQNIEESVYSINDRDKKSQVIKIDRGQLNRILYGPPGTGKTFSTTIHLNNILNNNIQMQENSFFITFHQSYSYEQFIEGIGVETNEETKEVEYKIKDGVFKKACNFATALATIEKNELIFDNNEDYSKLLHDYLKSPEFKPFKDRKNEDGTIEPSDFDNAPPVVIIIDEINRGNISKIFGELITLIEDDKRLGEDNELIVTLPYSGEQFGVPPNLYIIGTMNTADRSLVQLDTALRRRFEFEEMMPKYHQTDKFKDSLKNEELLNWENEGKIDHYEISYFLKKLNEKICKEYDRDHQIGHSFLMKVKDLPQLQRAWENKIMPLLQEYFYSDYEKLSKVIGEKSDYLKKIENEWVLNMRVKDFDSQFKLVYDSVCGIKETIEIQKTDAPNTENK